MTHCETWLMKKRKGQPREQRGTKTMSPENTALILETTGRRDTTTWCTVPGRREPTSPSFTATTQCQTHMPTSIRFRRVRGQHQNQSAMTSMLMTSEVGQHTRDMAQVMTPIERKTWEEMAAEEGSIPLGNGVFYVKSV